MQKILKSGGIISSHKSEPIEDTNMKIVNYTNFLEKGDHTTRVSKQAITAVATWADNYDKLVTIGSVPRTLSVYNTL
jgi:hypothetical protein